MKIGYYPGCSSEGTALEYGQSIEAVAEALDIELIELEDWSCCGASSGHCTDETLSLALPARNMAIAEKMGQDMVVSCAACYVRFKATEHELKQDAQKRQEIAEIIGMPLELKYTTRHFLELIYHEIGLDKIRNRVRKPLTGLKAVCYYGCYLVRPPKVTRFDNPENPTMMDELMVALGAESIDWPCKIDCCSGSLAFTRVHIAKKLLATIMQTAIDVGANCIVTACPLCQANLDTRTPMSARKALPILYFSELLAVALGLEGMERWWRRHIFRPTKLLRSLNLIT
ncbi:MAG: CoB--CoM heterodisulfide reductase iron-sulfur subunit B family protein [candidate division KSB1 bacterium]|nr:CoB--CoM heterodisulfide reductase iron-sulfur subunit B family protein [candidate division KSB1 bacterium]